MISKITWQRHFYTLQSNISLSQEKLATLHKFIDENLATGLICLSLSPWSTSPLYSEERQLSQLCVNFQGLNWISKRDRYPFLLISEPPRCTMKGMSLHQNWSLAHIHLVWISPGDEWKTAFQALLQFIWVVGNAWRITNSPATFHRFMNKFHAYDWYHNHHIFGQTYSCTPTIFPSTKPTFRKYSADSVLMEFLPMQTNVNSMSLLQYLG